MKKLNVHFAVITLLLSISSIAFCYPIFERNLCYNELDRIIPFGLSSKYKMCKVMSAFIVWYGTQMKTRELIFPPQQYEIDGIIYKFRNVVSFDYFENEGGYEKNGSTRLLYISYHGKFTFNFDVYYKGQPLLSCNVRYYV
jgi:hypothetical protein